MLGGLPGHGQGVPEVKLSCSWAPCGTDRTILPLAVDLKGSWCAPAALPPERWKDGARCAVALSFDSDHETNELRDGGESIGRLS